jgi:mono/diheme cytochrome c family protein
MTPHAKNLADIGRERTPGELYWVIRHGIKMTGMPAWEFRLDEGELWALVAFVRELPSISPTDYADRLTKAQQAAAPADKPVAMAARPDADRGRRALHQYGCTTCHAIPGVVGEQAPVGPPLDRIGTREYIAGVLRNSRENMVRWLREPQAVNPRTAMPNLGVTQRDAVDMTEYLYQLR